MKKIIVLFAVFAVFALVIGATQAIAAESCDEKFKQIDVNNDGKIEWPEYKAAFNKGMYAGTVPSPSGNSAFMIFNDLDTNQDGYVSKEEYCGGYGFK